MIIKESKKNSLKFNFYILINVQLWHLAHGGRVSVESSKCNSSLQLVHLYVPFPGFSPHLCNIVITSYVFSRYLIYIKKLRFLKKEGHFYIKQSWINSKLNYFILKTFKYRFLV